MPATTGRTAAAAPEHGCPASPGLGGQLRHQPTLSDARLTGQQDERSANIKMVHRDAAKVPVEEIAQRLLEAIQPLPTVDARHGSFRAWS